MRKLLLLLALAAVALTAAGAAAARAWQATPPTRGVYLGRLTGTNAFVAIAIGHGQARAYLCDAQRLAVWLPPAQLSNGHLDLAGGDVHLTGSLRRRSSQGTITLPDGTRHAFSATLAPAGGVAGLYRATATVHGSRYLAGWIVLSAHAQRGNVLAFLPSHSTTIALHAPPLDPEAASVQLDGTGVVGVAKLADSFIDKTAGG